MSLSDSQTFRIQMDNTNFMDMETDLFKEEINSPFGTNGQTNPNNSPNDTLDFWEFESNSLASTPNTFEESSSSPKFDPFNENGNYFLEDKLTSPFMSSEESTVGSPFDSFLDKDVNFDDIKNFEDKTFGNSFITTNNKNNMITKLEGDFQNKSNFQQNNSQTQISPKMIPKLTPNTNISNKNKPLQQPQMNNFNNNNPNPINNQNGNNINFNFNNNYKITNNNNFNNSINNNINNNFNNNIKIQPNSIPKFNNPPNNNNNTTNKKSTDKTDKDNPTKKRKRVLIPPTNINPQPNEKGHKYLLTEEKVMTTTSEEIEMYITHLTKNKLISNEELKELKKQRRRIKNREYAKNKRVVNKGKVGDLNVRVQELEEENQRLKDHLRYVIHQFEVFKQQVSSTNSGNNTKVPYTPPNLPTYPNPTKNSKSNTLFVFVILFSLGFYFNIFSGLSLSFHNTGSASSRSMLTWAEKYYPYLETLYDEISPYLRSSYNSSSLSNRYSRIHDWKPQKNHFNQFLVPYAGYTTHNQSHLITYLAIEDTTRCFYQNKYTWIKRIFK